MVLLILYIALAFLVALIAQIRGRSAWRWLSIALFATPLLAGLLVMALPRQQSLPVFSERFSPAPPPEGEPAPADTTIRILRLSAHSDRFRPYDIFVNGAEVGAVVPNNVVDFHLPSGALVIEARSDWGVSPPLLVEAKPGHRVNIEVSNDWGLLRPWAIAFHSDRYLTLTRLSEMEAADEIGDAAHVPAA